LNALTGETVVHANPLGTVTSNCLVLRDETRRAQAIIGIESIKEMRRVNTTNPSFLVISAGLFTIAAGAYASHEPLQVSGIMGLIGIFFVLGYLATRRAAVLFLLEDQCIESMKGSYSDAISIMRAVRRARQPEA
jgi:hypothetical protein